MHQFLSETFVFHPLTIQHCLDIKVLGMGQFSISSCDRVLFHPVKAIDHLQIVFWIAGRPFGKYLNAKFHSRQSLWGEKKREPKALVEDYNLKQNSNQSIKSQKHESPQNNHKIANQKL